MANPIIDDTTPNIVPGDMSTSETLATQGNVINSLRTFWERLKTRLGYAIFRNSKTAGVGNDSKPVYVDSNGEVKECNATSINISLMNISNFASSTTLNRMSYNPSNDNYNMVLDIKPATGTMVYLTTPGNSQSTSEKQIKIRDSNSNTRSVYYTSGAPALVKDFAAQPTRFLLVYSNESGTDGRWIVLNNINEAKGNTNASNTDQGSGGNKGLMSAYDKAKLDSIQWGAKSNFSFGDLFGTPDASYNTKGLVKLGATGNISINTNNKVYPVQVDGDGHMGVSVPWQNDTNTHYSASIKVGSTENTADMGATNNDNTYVKIFEGGAYSSSFSIKGAGGTTVSSENASNEILITSQAGIPTFTDTDAGSVLAVNSSGNGTEWKSQDVLKTNTGIQNYSTTGRYLVVGPGSSKAKTNFYLAGDGSWQQAITRLYAGANKSSGVLSVNTAGTDFTGFLNLKTETDTAINFCIIGKNGKTYVSSSGALDVSEKLDTPPSNGGVMYVPYFPIGPNGGAFNAFYKPGVFKLTRSSNTITVTAL